MNPNLKQRVNQIRADLSLKLDPLLAQSRVTLEEKIHVGGLIRAHEVPFKSREEWEYWWLPQRNEAGTIIAPPRMSLKEKARYAVAEQENILTGAGITQLLNFIGSANGNSTPFAQYFAFGTGALVTVNTSDTSLETEAFRLAASNFLISGTQQDISVLSNWGASAIAITNAGLFGNGATATLNSGTLMTHSLFAYTQPAQPAGPQRSTGYDYLLTYE